MVARVLFPWLTPWGNTTAPHPRATIKALPASLHPPSPLRIIRTYLVRLMHIGPDLSRPRGGKVWPMPSLRLIPSDPAEDVRINLLNLIIGPYTIVIALKRCAASFQAAS